jgi:murein DD-endopeptidase MepM/ murein hydrolase activator NlpD
VRIGQHVDQGQVVGYAGTTGYSTGTHLHFEIRRGGVPVNPLGYLP